MTVYDITTLRPVEADQEPVEDALDTLVVDAEATVPAGTPRSFVTRGARPVLVVRKTLTHQYTRTAARQVAYVAAGALIVRRNRRDAVGTARHERMMRAAEVKGDHETALLWEQRAAAHRAARHARRMQLLKEGPIHLAKALVTAGIVAAGSLILIGMVLAGSTKQMADVVRPLMDTVAFARLVGRIIAALWWPTMTLAPVAVLTALWNLGRTRSEVPLWLAPQNVEQGPASVTITPSVVVVALRDLGFAPLRNKIKEMADGAAAMLGPITLAGVGREVDVYLPSGTQTQDILDRHQRLAENLGRHRHELYISIPERARTVRLWIADVGALNLPIEASPLVDDADMTANWFTGAAPWGVDQRREPVGFRPKQRHVLLTGLSNHGKTFALRALLLWCAFDPSVEFRIADFKGVGDWSMFEGLATELIEGPSDKHVIAGTHMIEATVQEMEERLERARGMGFKDGVPESVARKPGSGFHPIVVAVDEAQKAIMCPAIDGDKNPYGGLTNRSRFLTGCREIQNQGRAVNVVLYLGTQDPTPQNFPVLLRNSSHLRASLPLGSKGQAEMVLGEDAVAGGAAPHRLRRGVDKGVVVGFGEGLDFPVGASHMTVWTYFLNGEDAHVIAERAKARRKAVTTRAGHLGDDQDAEPLDLLADVAGILGDAVRMPKAEMTLRLAELDDRYRGWTDARLKAELEAVAGEGAQYTYIGLTHIHGARVREALARRISATEEPESEAERRA